MERRGGDCYDLCPLEPSSTISRILLDWKDDWKEDQGGCRKPNDQRSRKKCKTSSGVELSQWADLPEELLLILTKRFSLVDYMSFSRVCTRWRSTSMASRKDFLESLPPFVVVVSVRGKRACFFFNIANGQKYKTKLPTPTQKVFLGISSGYLVIEPPREILWFANPVTGHLIEVPKPPQSDFVNTDHEVATIASIIPQKDYLIVALSRSSMQIHFRRYWEAKWIPAVFNKEERNPLDVAILEFKIYTLFVDGHVGILNLKSGCITFLELEERPNCCSNKMRFVVNDDRLLVINFIPDSELQLFEIDLSGKKWVRIDDLGDQAVAVSAFNGIRLINPKNWGGQTNCLYYMGIHDLAYRLVSLECEEMGVIYIDIDPRARCPRTNFGWLFPEQAYKMDVVWDDQHGDMPENYRIE